jgi:ribosomal protein S18 acetylase RimI-like enzyme
MMRIQHIDRAELARPAAGGRQSWLDAAWRRLLRLPDHPRSRVLVAAANERIQAILGLELNWAADGRLERATIVVLEIDPEFSDRSAGLKLVRVAQDIAHINGCDRVNLAPDLERWIGGGRRPKFDRPNVSRGSSRNTTPPTRRSCA